MIYLGGTPGGHRAGCHRLPEGKRTDGGWRGGPEDPRGARYLSGGRM